MYINAIFNISIAQTKVGGPVSGIWDHTNSPYLVNDDDIIISNGDTLIIKPGVEVVFNSGGFEFTVYGTLLAEGTSDSLIVFRGAIDNPGIWNGIHFFVPDSSNKLAFCLIKNAGGDADAAVKISCNDESKLTISNSIIMKNYANGITINQGDSLVIRQCNILNNRGNGVYYSPGDKSGSPNLTSNIIINNDEFGIVNDGKSNMCYNLVWNNRNGNFLDSFKEPHVPLGVLTGTNSNGDSCDSKTNISFDPLFVDLQNDNFHLRKDSPCINAGDLFMPQDPDGTQADIGVYYYDTSIEDLPGSTTNNVLARPNPFTPNNDGFNDYVKFDFPSVTENSFEILIFDVSGKKVATLSSAVSRNNQWYGTDDKGNKMAPGVYIYIIKINGSTEYNGTITLIR